MDRATARAATRRGRGAARVLDLVTVAQRVSPFAVASRASVVALSLASFSALLTHCSAKDAATPLVDAGAPEAAEAADAGGETAPTQLALPATQGSWLANVDLNVTGRGSGELGAISLTHGVGTITFHGAPAKALYFVGSVVPLGTDAGAADSALADEYDFEIIAEQEGRIIATWLTCYKGSLAYVYYESTDGLASTKSQSASGTCTVVAQPTTETPAWPAFSFPAPSVVSGFTITGTDLAFDGKGPGTIALNGTSWALHPFHAIDCTACASPGWWELHSILWNPDGAGACLGILYLQKNAPTSVELAYLMCFPDLTSPIPNDQKMYAASWTSP
jgi:hypothetical protein